MAAAGRCLVPQPLPRQEQPTQSVEYLVSTIFSLGNRGDKNGPPILEYCCTNLVLGFTVLSPPEPFSPPVPTDGTSSSFLAVEEMASSLVRFMGAGMALVSLAVRVCVSGQLTSEQSRQVSTNAFSGAAGNETLLGGCDVFS